MRLPNRPNTIPFRTDERDQIHRMIEKYRCSPFTGKCHVEQVSFVKDKKTGLYHIILSQKQVDELSDFSVQEGQPLHHLMFMIRPTDEDSDYLIFKKVEDI